jgi:hypothetical protein
MDSEGALVACGIGPGPAMSIATGFKQLIVPYIFRVLIGFGVDPIRIEAEQAASETAAEGEVF